MIAQINMRKGTSAEWAAAAPVILLAGESGYDTTLKRYKVGDGETEWANLEWNTLWSRPVGSIYESTVSTSPASLFGGTWEAIDAGRFLVAAGSGYPAGGTGGRSSFSLTRENLPDIAFDMLTQGNGSNTWGLPAPTSQGTADWIAGYVRSGGSGDAISIIPPWYAVYMWVRTA